MSAVDYLNGTQFRFTAAKSAPGAATPWLDTVHRVDALSPSYRLGKDPVGRITWEPHNGRVESLKVQQPAQRQGIATNLWHEAHASAKQSDLIAPVHSDVQFPDGQAWIAGMARKDYQARQASRAPVRPTKQAPDENQGSLF